MDNGPSFKAAIELGRKLAAACEDHDVTGQWMAHHLAALVSAADAADGVTVEQRVEIIETILKVWGARRKLPGQVPGYELDQVYIALDMLGDDRPWRFSRLQSYAAGLDAAKDARAPLAATAVTLERLTRQTVLALVWRACQDAASRNEEWLVAAAAAMAPLKDELSANTRSVHRRLRDLVGDEAFDGADYEEKTELSTSNLALRLRTMADQLHGLADELDGMTSPSP
ncbi:hypothetical protein CVS30_12665 [Arthrobacter psychrolactophilus]|uniref:Uncharacterized protein n=1 Tax=Arthrobacter psychrolactophilus TaxID=92442 RepID=A0A2V5JKC4_9MICC|nr:hypothetical protein [Arthrobacter psychrolactophilus]PYI37916.1 hypothetical protein CVS30_12665 [Arthrobacter psychrolactophilus]